MEVLHEALYEPLGPLYGGALAFYVALYDAARAALWWRSMRQYMRLWVRFREALYETFYEIVGPLYGDGL